MILRGVTARRLLAVGLLLGATLCAPAAAWGLALRQTLWGFDGQVVPDRINIVSVLVINESSTPFSGSLRLERVNALGRVIGAPQAQDCYLAPLGERWVQFCTLNGDQDEEWSVRWGSGLRDSVKLPVPRRGAPVRVYFADSSEVTGARLRLKAFPEEIFPPTVAATDGLDEVVLDHAPRWEAARREAFMDWLRRGGKVHLLVGAEGQYPRFTAEMSALNEEKAFFRVGSGLVVRHLFNRSQATDNAFKSAGYPALKLYQDQEYWGSSGVEEYIFNELAMIIRPRHSWALIYLLIVAYIVLIGPVNYLLGRRWRDWKRTTLLYLGIVGGACLMLGFIGRRGQEESAAAHVVGYARQVDAGRWDVTEWINGFVTIGGYYTVQHRAPHNIYSAVSESEAVNGLVRNGPEGTFSADMPLFSSRAFLFRGRMPGPDLGLKLVTWNEEGAGRALEIACGPGFPEETLQMHAVAGGRLFTLGRKDNALFSGPGAAAQDVLKAVALRDNNYSYGRSWRDSDDDEQRRSPEAVAKRAWKPLISYALGGTKGLRPRFVRDTAAADDAAKQAQPQEPPLPLDPDDIHVFVYAPVPKEFRLVRNPFGRETGYVLYHVILKVR